MAETSRERAIRDSEGIPGKDGLENVVVADVDRFIGIVQAHGVHKATPYNMLSKPMQGAISNGSGPWKPGAGFSSRNRNFFSEFLKKNKKTLDKDLSI
jgi:hypothetical protein